MSTQERLEGYGFNPHVVDTVSDFADQISQHDNYSETFEAVGIGELKTVQYDGYMPVSLLDIRPEEHDPKAAMFIHLAMANPLDPNQLYQIAAIAGTNPNTRIIAAGNPSGPGYNTGKLTQSQRKAVAHGDLRPVVDPMVKYAEENGIDWADQVGYSFGADRAMTAATSDAYQVRKAVAIEPASVKDRNLVKLGLAFGSTAKHLDHYVKESGTPAFEAARKDSVGAMAYNLGLARLSNIAIARCLSIRGFEQRTDDALEVHPETEATIAWGTESELAINGLMKPIVHRLQRSHGAQRVNPVVIEGGKHALANDIHLQAAIVLNGLSN